jgi:hypothetical protein
MNRRELDRLLVLGTALAAGWPAWLRRAFAAAAGDCAPPAADGEQRWRQMVSASYRRAQQAGKPLLALVIPAVDAESGRGFDTLWERGQVFGELLNHGDDDALATLALAEIVCAPMAALRGMVPGLAPGEPLAVLVETDGVPARVRVLDDRLPSVRASAPRRPPADWAELVAEEQRRENEAAGRRMAVLARLLHAGLRATPQMLAERAAQAQARLGVTAGLSENAAPAQVHRLAALLLAAAVAQPPREQASAVRRIADAARTVLCRRRVPGSRWADASGCGSRVEWEPDETPEELHFACGMGRVPEQSRRFLDFLTADARWRSSS